MYVPARVATVLLATAALVASAAPAFAVAFDETPDPTWQTNGRVNAVVYAGNAVYIGGEFTRVRPPGSSSGDVVRNRLAAFEVATGDLLPWNPNANRAVEALELSTDGTSILVGGRFDRVRGAVREGLARVHLQTGELTPWAPMVDGYVRTIEAKSNGNRVYVGGHFTEANGVRRRHLAAFDADNGRLLTSWQPMVRQADGPCPPRCFVAVHDLALSDDEDTVYIGGAFASVDGVARNSAAAVSAVNAELRPFDPNVYSANTTGGSRNMVYDIELGGSRAFLCGDFWRVGGVRSPNVAAVDLASGTRLAVFDVKADGAVNACVAGEGVLFLGGHFDHVGRASNQDDPGPYRQHLAAVDRGHGALDPWDPGASSVPGVYALALSPSRTRLAVGGQFRETGGVQQQGFAQFG